MLLVLVTMFPSALQQGRGHMAAATLCHTGSMHV